MSGLYEQIFRRVMFPLYESLLRRRKTLSYLREYEQSQWLSRDEIDALQWQKLKRLLEHCWREVPYYQQQWKALGISNAEDFRAREDYSRLPMLTKPEIRSHFEALHAPSLRTQLHYKTTGGSTGEPLRFGYTRESYERRIAVMWRGYGWAGARMGRRTLYLWGAAVGAPLLSRDLKDRAYHGAFNRRMLNAFLMNEHRMFEYVKEIDRYRPEIIVGYV
ncbi:MAG: phenylacetate--CoA ligase family protein, partial [Dokdonella sp.]